eukprot:TRINITY_DN6535_c0_g1_i1.p1 TRINITY_DN6535_c0_g1~~TRINITY_DN6535_c0_g1_i1.p1  ORF type:complete len:477 (+),score=85.44 TRINITY_DN6535_c0_g1_i1:122-1552(+)
MDLSAAAVCGAVQPRRPCRTAAPSAAWRWIAVALVSLGGQLADAKLQIGTLQLGGLADSQDRWQFMSKFGFGLGEGTYSVRVRPKNAQVARDRGNASDVYGFPLRRVVHLELELFLDEDWHKTEPLTPCRRAKDAPARRTLPLELDLDRPGEWSLPAAGLLYHVMRSHIWYFAVSSCGGGDDLGGDGKPLELEYEFHARQQDGSEFSVEARYMPAAEALALLGLSAFLVRSARRCEEIQRSAGALHPVIWVLGAALLLRYVSHVANLIHLIKYRSDGVGLHSLDLLAEVLFMLSQAVHGTLLLAIAKGYTLLPMKEGDSTLAMIASLAAHAALVCFGKLQESTSPYRHHDNDGLAGWGIVFIRLVLFAWFCYSLQLTRARGSFMLKDFLNRFQLAGSLYFLAYPLVFIVAQLFAPYLRAPIMVISLLLVQASADYWLAELFTQRGAYFKVSTLSASLLPGGIDCSPASSLGWDKSC